jgi:hypothetical protein
MKHMLTGFLPFISLSTHAEIPPIGVCPCPASAVHTYPSESRREVNGLLLQNFAILVPRPIQSRDVVIAK